MFEQSFLSFQRSTHQIDILVLMLLIGQHFYRVQLRFLTLICATSQSRSFPLGRSQLSILILNPLLVVKLVQSASLLSFELVKDFFSLFAIFYDFFLFQRSRDHLLNLYLVFLHLGDPFVNIYSIFGILQSISYIFLRIFFQFLSLKIRNLALNLQTLLPKLYLPFQFVGDFFQLSSS